MYYSCHPFVLTSLHFHNMDIFDFIARILLFIYVNDVIHLFILFFILVYNWTTDDVITWLKVQVELPQYVENFRAYPVNGRLLPRLAFSSNNHQVFLSFSLSL